MTHTVSKPTPFLSIESLYFQPYDNPAGFLDASDCGEFATTCGLVAEKVLDVLCVTRVDVTIGNGALRGEHAESFARAVTDAVCESGGDAQEAIATVLRAYGGLATVAECLGRLAAAEYGGEAWAPVAWCPTDEKAIDEAAELLGEKPMPGQWRDLFAAYSNAA
jgi:hypothetical protein